MSADLCPSVHVYNGVSCYDIHAMHNQSARVGEVYSHLKTDYKWVWNGELFIEKRRTFLLWYASWEIETSIINLFIHRITVGHVRLPSKKSTESFMTTASCTALLELQEILW